MYCGWTKLPTSRRGGQAAETLMNVVALTPGDLAPMFALAYCSNRPNAKSAFWRPTSDSAANVSELFVWASHEDLPPGRGSMVRPSGALEQRESSSSFKYFKESGEEAYSVVPRCPLIDRGVLQGVLVIQTIEARSLPRRRDPHVDASLPTRFAPW